MTISSTLRGALIATALLSAIVIRPAFAFSTSDIVAVASSSVHLWLMSSKGLVHCGQTACREVLDSPPSTRNISAKGSSLWVVTGNATETTPWFCTVSRCNQGASIPGKVVSLVSADTTSWVVTSDGVYFCEPSACRKISTQQ